MESTDINRPMQSNVIKAFVSDDGLASIICPNCGLTKQVPIADYSGKGQTLKVRCRCKQLFTIRLEFRQSHRKRTALSGTYLILSKQGGGSALIQDLSKDGIGIMVSDFHKVRVGQKLQINFSLDDRKQTPLQKKATVKSVNENRIGCEFSKMHAFEKDLGFYLRV